VRREHSFKERARTHRLLHRLTVVTRLTLLKVAMQMLWRSFIFCRDFRITFPQSAPRYTIDEQYVAQYKVHNIIIYRLHATLLRSKNATYSTDSNKSVTEDSNLHDVPCSMCVPCSVSSFVDYVWIL
jgi:hypothetical protein